MRFSHLLKSDFALTTGKHTQMTKENSKGMKDLSASNVPRRGERASNLTCSKCLHLVDFNNPRYLMTHDKMAVTAN